MVALLVASACGGDDTTGTGTADTSATDPTGSSTGTMTTDPTDPTAETSAETTATTVDETGSSSGTNPTTGVDGSTGSSGTETTASDSSSTGGESSTGDACQPVTEDVSAIGQDCVSDDDCPDAYACIDAGAFAPQPLCRIPCTMDCECPDGLSCQVIEGKAMVGNECRQ